MSTDPKAQAQTDLIDALLTLDSYNRGYGSGINNLDETGPNAITVTRAITPLLSGGTVKLIPTHTQFSYIRLTC